MNAEQRRKLAGLEGRTVHLALVDGSRLDAVDLISARRNTVWIFHNGEDAFIPMHHVIDVWETRPVRWAA